MEIPKDIREAGDRAEAGSLGIRGINKAASMTGGAVRVSPLARGLGRIAAPIALADAASEASELVKDKDKAIKKFYDESKGMSASRFALHQIQNPATAIGAIADKVSKPILRRIFSVPKAPPAPPKDTDYSGQGADFQSDKGDPYDRRKKKPLPIPSPADTTEPEPAS